MKRVAAIFALLAILAVAVPALLNRDAGTYRFRLNLTVETPNCPRTASTVLGVHYSLRSGLMSNSSGRADAQARGEAVFLDLGQGRSLVMLLAHGPRGEDVDQTGWLPTSALLGLYGWDAVQALLNGRTLAGMADLRGRLIPTLVTFSNLHYGDSALN